MTHAGYVAAGWVIAWATIGFYAWWVIRRGKRLSQQVSEAERRWASPGRAGNTM